MSHDDLSIEELNELATTNAKNFLINLKEVSDPVIKALLTDLFSITLYRTSALVKTSNETSETIDELLEIVKDNSKTLDRIFQDNKSGEP